MTVDAHHHVWDLSVRDQDWITGPELQPLRRNFTVADLEPEARAAGVDRTVLVQTVTVAEETPEFLALAAESELIGGVIGWTDLTRPDVADELARLAELPGGAYLRGIRHQVQGEPDPDWLLRPDVRRGLAAVAGAGLVHDLVVLPHQLPACVKSARDLPELIFVLDHLGKPPIASGAREPWATHVRALAALPNTVCKLSGMVTEAGPGTWTADALRPYADTVLDAFGPGRLMFGSDWPVCTLAASYGQVIDVANELTAALGADEREDLFSGTATRVYGL
ncbi:amidohydrolase [Streptomyces avermitilis]|uniref:Amidohydrolase n=1 Tax=Streptomyces avermitilis TaxID=33903 RepID=A0A4D4MJA8_STRAX|nr:amidohydrolase family protein [Streptomyces avermitilis]MYT02825.1 amidohydrolase family protein [Streptomyces sp. SID5469]KUN53384.1 amidohydrolase [Streptomyces avermitilis]GDY67586.1 amidohydrolase [Streptomyces avermitilis]GDY72110.1 amidohydrolase [Streptomyces avermitilis]GDY81268.1 amidohydrolase [Streptomyces avermitilis]